MVAQLRPEQITYDQRVGRYRSEFGGFVSAADIDQVVRSEGNRLNARLQTITDALLTEALPIALWEEAIAVQLKQSHMRVLALGAGGDAALRASPVANRYFGMAGRNLRDVYASVRRLGDQIENGELTPAQIKDRVRRQALTVRPAHSRAELLTRTVQQGHNEAIRWLDMTVEHCPSCPNYSTNGEYVPISEVVPVGHACECGGNCRCGVRTRFNPRRAIAQIGQVKIEDVIERAEEVQTSFRVEVQPFQRRPQPEWTPPETVRALGQGAFGKVSTTANGTVLKESIRIEFVDDDPNPVQRPLPGREVDMQRRASAFGLAPKVIGSNPFSIEMEDLSESHESLYDAQRIRGRKMTAEGLESLTDAYEKMHRARMAHGDAHDENIFVNKQTGLEDVRFIDYGFADEIGGDGYLASLRSDLKSYAMQAERAIDEGVTPSEKTANSTVWRWLQSRPVDIVTDFDLNEVEERRIEFEDAQEYIKSLIGEDVE